MTVEEAQLNLDHAVRLATEAQHAAAAKQGDVARARERLEEAKREAAAKIPVDRSAQQLTDGSPVTPDHREINPATGQQKGYVVLSAFATRLPASNQYEMSHRVAADTARNSKSL